MKPTLILLAALIAAAGCNRVAKVDNPVAPEPPPRMSLNDATIPDPVAKEPPADDSGQFMVRDETEPGGEVQGIPSYEEWQLTSQEDSFQQVRATNIQDPSKEDLGSATGTVALVNGEPIFAEDVLQEFAPQLAMAQKRWPEEKFREQKAKLLRARLPVHIESKLLSTAMMKSLEKEQRGLCWPD